MVGLGRGRGDVGAVAGDQLIERLLFGVVRPGGEGASLLRVLLDVADDRLAGDFGSAQVLRLAFLPESRVHGEAFFGPPEDAAPALAEPDGIVGAGVPVTRAARAQLAHLPAELMHLVAEVVFADLVHLPVEFPDDRFVRMDLRGGVLEEEGVVACEVFGRLLVPVDMRGHLVVLREGNSDVHAAGVVAQREVRLHGVGPFARLGHDAVAFVGPVVDELGGVRGVEVAAAGRCEALVIFHHPLQPVPHRKFRRVFPAGLAHKRFLLTIGFGGGYRPRNPPSTGMTAPVT